MLCCWPLTFLNVKLTSFLLSLSLWMSQRMDAWGDLGRHSRKVVLFFTPYCVISTAFLYSNTHKHTQTQSQGSHVRRHLPTDTNPTDGLKSVSSPNCEREMLTELTAATCSTTKPPTQIYSVSTHWKKNFQCIRATPFRLIYSVVLLQVIGSSLSWMYDRVVTN